MLDLIHFVKTHSKQLSLTQQDPAERRQAVAYLFRDKQQGKASLRMDNVNLVLALFGHE